MSYIVETQHTVSPVVINVLNEDFSPAQELGAALDEIGAAFDSMTEPFYYVSDTSKAKWNFGEMVQAMSSAASRGMNLLKNPHLKEIIVVTDSSLIQLGVSALGQEQYGMVRARTVPTLEAALDYINGAAQASA